MGSSSDRKVDDGIGVEEGCSSSRMSCVECRTTTTPMWRGGPTGRRSLCNACGIRYRKKRRQELGLDQKLTPQQQQHIIEEATTSEVKDINNNSSNLQQKSRVQMEVEEAALLLMTLSSPTFLHG